MKYSVIMMPFEGDQAHGDFFEIQTQSGNFIIVFTDERNVDEFLPFARRSATDHGLGIEVVQIEVNDVPKLVERAAAVSEWKRVILDTDPMFPRLLKAVRSLESD